ATPRRNFSCTAGLHEFGNSTLPSLSPPWAEATLAAASERAINGAAIRIRVFMCDSPRRNPSFPFQLQVLVGRRERVGGDEAEPRLLHPRADAVETRIQPERREDSLVVDELLDALEHGAAPLLIQLGRLLAEQAIDVGVAPVRIDAAAGHEGLDAGGG